MREQRVAQTNCEHREGILGGASRRWCVLGVQTVLSQVEGHRDPRQILLVPAEPAILVDMNSSRSTSLAGNVEACSSTNNTTGTQFVSGWLKTTGIPTLRRVLSNSRRYCTEQRVSDKLLLLPNQKRAVTSMRGISLAACYVFLTRPDVRRSGHGIKSNRHYVYLASVYASRRVDSLQQLPALRFTSFSRHRLVD